MSKLLAPGQAYANEAARQQALQAIAQDTTKADKAYVDTQLSLKYDTSTATTQLGAKADKTYVDLQLATKPSNSELTTALGLKADLTYVNTELGLKANTSALATKADTTYVDTQLGLKVNTSAFTTALGLKADLTYVDTQLGLKADSSALALKADTTAVNNALALKASAADVDLIKPGSNQWLITHAMDPTPLFFGTLNLNSNNVVISASVRWPDGTVGTYTSTIVNASFNVVDAYTITYGGSAVVVSQAVVTRNSDGYVILRPALTVTRT